MQVHQAFCPKFVERVTTSHAVNSDRSASSSLWTYSLRDDFNIDTAIDQLYGSLYYRLLLGSGVIDEQFIEDTYQQFLIGHQARLAVRRKV